MALIKISTDGTEFELKDDIARDDQRLREALTPFYPEMANAEITRSEQDGRLVVTMAKRAGTKGFSRADVLTVLRNAAEMVNPAVLMQDKLRRMEERGELDVQKLMRLQPGIRRAMNDGQKQIKEVKASLKLLADAKPVAARSVPGGF
ncbi:MAG: hypothetical protein AB7U82_05785 [Blastocatellales bacterium]